VRNAKREVILSLPSSFLIWAIIKKADEKVFLKKIRNVIIQVCHYENIMINICCAAIYHGNVIAYRDLKVIFQKEKSTGMLMISRRLPAGSGAMPLSCRMTSPAFG